MRTLVVNWENVNVFHKYWLEHHKLRHKIFVERMSWNVQTYNGMEFDEFDTPAAVYILAIDDVDHVCGVARLCPTDRPYMIEKLWPDLFQQELPKTSKIWEATRFGICNTLSAKQRAAAASSIIKACYHYGQTNEIDEFLMLMPVFVYQRIFIPNGIDYTLASKIVEIDGIKSAIASVEITPQMIHDQQHLPSMNFLPRHSIEIYNAKSP